MTFPILSYRDEEPNYSASIFLAHKTEHDISTALCFGNHHFIKDQHRIPTFIRLRYQIFTKKHETLGVLDIYQSMKTFEILLEDKLE